MFPPVVPPSRESSLKIIRAPYKQRGPSTLGTSQRWGCSELITSKNVTADSLSKSSVTFRDTVTVACVWLNPPSNPWWTQGLSVYNSPQTPVLIKDLRLESEHGTYQGSLTDRVRTTFESTR